MKRNTEKMKLFRDRIPEIIQKSGKIPEYEVITDERVFENLLNQKLTEEVKEYLASGNIEEICDILEVLYAIMDIKKWDAGYVEDKRREKAQLNGSFERRVLLKKVWE